VKDAGFHKENPKSGVNGQMVTDQHAKCLEAQAAKCKPMDRTAKTGSGK